MVALARRGLVNAVVRREEATTMATGRGNTLTGQLAEHLVCAELARRGLIATTFSHNVPTFDVLATDEFCRTVPIQVKATTNDSWRTSADRWMTITKDKKRETQTAAGEKQLATPDLIWVCVAVGSKRKKDRFFILTERHLQRICIRNYGDLLRDCKGHRPKNWESLDCWWDDTDLAKFEDNWQLIIERLQSDKADRALGG
jgi:hypothetical protein